MQAWALGIPLSILTAPHVGISQNQPIQNSLNYRTIKGQNRDFIAVAPKLQNMSQSEVHVTTVRKYEALYYWEGRVARHFVMKLLVVVPVLSSI